MLALPEPSVVDVPLGVGGDVRVAGESTEMEYSIGTPASGGSMVT
jgi:hypothetical protein